MADVGPEDFGNLKLDAWHRYEMDLSEYLMEMKDEV